jgi:hypothetical protein
MSTFGEVPLGEQFQCGEDLYVKVAEFELPGQVAVNCVFVDLGVLDYLVDNEPVEYPVE